MRCTLIANESLSIMRVKALQGGGEGRRSSWLACRRDAPLKAEVVHLFLVFGLTVTAPGFPTIRLLPLVQFATAYIHIDYI